jgi:hypothetical protein
MKRLWVVCCALLFCAGCSSEWDEFWRDARLDNMKMRSFSSSSDSSSSLRPRDY